MVYSIALSGRLSFPASRAAKLRASVIDAEAFDDWPSAAALFDAGPSAPRSADAILTALAESARAKVEWADDSLKVTAIVSADDPRWVQGGRCLLALFRGAGAVGAFGGMGLTRWTDGGPSDVVSIKTKADGSSSVTIMTGKHADNAAKAIHSHVEELARAGRGEPVFRAAELPVVGAALALHRAVVQALKKCDPKQLFELARALDLPEETETFAFTPNPLYRLPLTTQFRSANALLDAFENGWPGLVAADASRLSKRALDLLSRLDREQATALSAAAATER